MLQVITGMRNFGLLVTAITVLIGGSIALILIRPNVNDDNARYLLSVIPQVIGTVFVLTVAIMQAFGGSEFMDIKRLTSQLEFKVTAIFSCLVMTAPLVVLYFNLFCIGSAICLSLFVSNLLVIAWFIFSVAPEQAMGKSLSKLKRETLDILSLGIPSDAIPSLEKMAEIGKKQIKKNIQITKEACKAIRDVILPTANRTSLIWDKAIELLIDLDKEIRNNNKIDYSEEITIPYMQYLSVCSTFNETWGWSKIKDYLFELFRNDIQNGKLDFDKPISSGKQDAFIAIKNLIYGAKQKDQMELFEELRDFLINELKDAMRKEILRLKYKIPAFVFIFNAIVESFFVRSMRLDPKYKQKLERELSEFAKIVNEPITDLFSNEARSLIPKYQILGYDSKALYAEFAEIKKEYIKKQQTE
jgi:hypothetical protein